MLDLKPWRWSGESGRSGSRKWRTGSSKDDDGDEGLLNPPESRRCIEDVMEAKCPRMAEVLNEGRLELELGSEDAWEGEESGDSRRSGMGEAWTVRK